MHALIKTSAFLSHPVSKNGEATQPLNKISRVITENKMYTAAHAMCKDIGFL